MLHEEVLTLKQLEPYAALMPPPQAPITSPIKKLSYKSLQRNRSRDKAAGEEVEQGNRVKTTEQRAEVFGLKVLPNFEAIEKRMQGRMGPL